MLATAPIATTTPPPPCTGIRPWRWTREQYYKLGELGFFQGKRVELLYGEIVEMSPINWPHVVCTQKTAELLKGLFTGIGWVGQGVPLDLGNSDPEPDVTVFPGRIEDYTSHPTTALLVVEVAESSLNNDLSFKAELYATAGVPEYWVIDLEHRQLHVFRDPQPLPAGLGATAYRTHLTFPEGDSLSPLAGPNATVRVADLLP